MAQPRCCREITIHSNGRLRLPCEGGSLLDYGALTELNTNDCVIFEFDTMFIDQLTYASIKCLLGDDVQTLSSIGKLGGDRIIQRITLRTNGPDLSQTHENNIIRRPFKNGLVGMVNSIVLGRWDCEYLIEIIEPLIKRGDFKFPNEGTLIGKQFYFENIANYIQFLRNVIGQLDEAGVYILFHCLSFLLLKEK